MSGCTFSLTVAMPPESPGQPMPGSSKSSPLLSTIFLPTRSRHT